MTSTSTAVKNTNLKVFKGRQASDLLCRRTSHLVQEKQHHEYAGRSGIRIQVRAKDFSILENVQTGSGAHPTCYSMQAELLSWP
jgi:hypothetical protein